MRGIFVPFWNNLLPLYIYIYIYIYISVGICDSVMYKVMLTQCASQRTLGLRHEAATALFLGCGCKSRQEHVYLSLVSVVPCQVEVSATYQSLIRRSPSECRGSEFVFRTSTMRRARTTIAVEPLKKMPCPTIL